MTSTKENDLDQNDDLTSTPPPKFQLNILAIVKMTRLQNGLRHQNHARYRTYCAKRLRRLRKAVQFTHGRGKVFVARAVEADIVTDERHLYIPLMNAERSWSYAMELKQELIEKDEPRKRFHASRKMRKAVKWAVQLKELCSRCCDDRTSLEAAAYAEAMKGQERLDSEDWSTALTSFEQASHLYEQLGKFGLVDDQEMYLGRVAELVPSIKYCQYNLARLNGAQSESAAKALAELKKAAKADNNFKAEQEILNAKLESVMAEARKRQAEAGSLSQVVWRDRRVRVRSTKVQELLIAARDRVQEIQTSTLSITKSEMRDSKFNIEDCLSSFLSVFGYYDDASKLVSKSKQTKKTNEKEITAAAAIDEEKLMAEYKLLSAYIRDQKVHMQAERNLFLVHYLEDQFDMQRNSELFLEKNVEKKKKKSKKVKPSDLIRLYDTLLENVVEIKRVWRSVVSKQDRDTENEENFASLEELDETLTKSDTILQQESNFRFLRCFYTALMYESQNKYAEAFALFERCHDLGSDLDDVSELISRVRREQSRCRAHVFLESLSKKDENSGNKSGNKKSSSVISKFKQNFGRFQMNKKEMQPLPLYERLDVYEDGASKENGKPHIMPFPPAYEAVPCKPLLFDLAFNYLDPPSLTHRLNKEDLAKVEKMEKFEQEEEEKRRRMSSGNEKEKHDSTKDENSGLLATAASWTSGWFGGQ
eukprot:g217.t1